MQSNFPRICVLFAWFKNLRLIDRKVREVDLPLNIQIWWCSQSSDLHSSLIVRQVHTYPAPVLALLSQHICRGGEGSNSMSFVLSIPSFSYERPISPYWWEGVRGDVIQQTVRQYRPSSSLKSSLAAFRCPPLGSPLIQPLLTLLVYTSRLNRFSQKQKSLSLLIDHW